MCFQGTEEELGKSWKHARVRRDQPLPCTASAQASKEFEGRIPKWRGMYGGWLDTCGFEVGIEIGVQRGFFSAVMLKGWTSAKEYHQIDVWAPQTNYVDEGNVKTDEQLRRMEMAMNNTMEFASKTRIFQHRMRSDQAAAKFQDESIDFAYIDARHDFCGVTQDLEMFWPKLRRGGVYAGHDFMYTAGRGNNYNVCEDGSVQKGATRRAVEEFAKRFNLRVHQTEHQPKMNPSWALIKPL